MLPTSNLHAGQHWLDQLRGKQLQLLPGAASTPTRSHPVYFGERKEIRHSPRKNVCLETFWAVGTLQTKYWYQQVKDNG